MLLRAYSRIGSMIVLCQILVAATGCSTDAPPSPTGTQPASGPASTHAAAGTGHTATAVASSREAPAVSDLSGFRYSMVVDLEPYRQTLKRMPWFADGRKTALRGAVAEKDWFFIARFLANGSQREEAAKLIDERIEHYLSNYVSRTSAGSITIRPGGIGLVRCHKPTSRFPGGWVGTLSLIQTRVPLPLTVYLVSCEKDFCVFGVTVDPEASPGSTYNCPFILCAEVVDLHGEDVTPRTGRITPAGEFVANPQNENDLLAKCIEYEVTVHVPEQSQFDADAALDIYLLRQRSLFRAREALDRKIKLLQSLKGTMTGQQVAESRRLEDEATAGQIWAVMCDDLIRRAVLHRDDAVSDMGRKCMFLRSKATCAGDSYTISALIRGCPGVASDDERVATEERFAKLQEILTRLDKAGEEEDPTRIPIQAECIVNDERVFLAGDKSYVDLILDDFAERERAYLRSVLVGEAADEVVRFLNRKGSPGARVLLSYAMSLGSNEVHAESAETDDSDERRTEP